MGFFYQATAVFALAFVAQLFMKPHQPVDLHTTAALAAFGGRDPATALRGTTVVVTGMTSGIGEELSASLLALGATVFGLARSPAKLKAFAAAHAGKAGVFQPVVCELSDLDSVAAAARHVTEALDGGSLDFLVNNAGIHYGGPHKLKSLDTTTKHGLDRSFVTNYLSHVLLTEKLLPRLAQAPHGARVLQISSSYHWQASGVDLDVPLVGVPRAADGSVVDLAQRRVAYANSKLAQIYHTRALAHAAKAVGARTATVKFVSVCPAWVGTNIAGDGFETTVVQALAFPPDQGIHSTLSAMFRPEIESGDFVGNADIITKLPLLRWVITSDVASKHYPLVRQYVTDAFAAGLMLFQKYDFGCHVQASSPESYDAARTNALHLWSLETLEPWL